MTDILGSLASAAILIGILLNRLINPKRTPARVNQGTESKAESPQPAFIDKHTGDHYQDDHPVAWFLIPEIVGNAHITDHYQDDPVAAALRPDLQRSAEEEALLQEIAAEGGRFDSHDLADGTVKYVMRTLDCELVGYGPENRRHIFCAIHEELSRRIGEADAVTK